MKQHVVNHYFTFSNMKANVVARFNQTLKNEMRPKFSLGSKYKWMVILPELMKQYIGKKHRNT